MEGMMGDVERVTEEKRGVTCSDDGSETCHAA